MPGGEDTDAFLAEFLEGMKGLGIGFLLLGMGLAIELVGIADELLLEGFGDVIESRKGEVALGDLVGGETGAGMSLCYTGMTFQAFAAEDLGTQATMADVGFCTVAEDAGGIGVKDAYIVEHGCLVEELQVELPLWM